MPSQHDIELRMLGLVIIDRENGAYFWGIDNAGRHGGCGAKPDGGAYADEYRKGAHKTEKAALDAAIRYIWAARPDIVAIAKNEAYEAERFSEKA